MTRFFSLALLGAVVPFLLLLAACGGSGGGNNNLSALLVSPSTVNVAEGATQQFTVTTQNGSSAPAVNWQVNGTVGGNATVGTISAAGLYTAPQTIPKPSSVNITAVAQSNSSQTGTAIATITSVALGNASLKGQYILNISGVTAGGFSFFELASLALDGNGNVTGGELDINGLSIGYSSANGLTGNYTVGSDGRGTLTINSSIASFQYAIAVQALNNATVNEVDTNFQNGYGTMELQATGTVTPSSTYAFLLRGTNGNSLAAVGQVVLTNPAAVSGTLDANTGGTITLQSSVSGAFGAIDGMGRGTASLTSGIGTASLVYYAVSANRFHFLEIDSSAAELGVATMQTQSSFATTDFSGNYVQSETAITQSGNGKAYSAMQFNSSGGGSISSGSYDANDTGSITNNASVSGAYSINTQGRIAGSFTAGGNTLPYIIYLVSPGIGYYLDIRTNAVGYGNVYAQDSSVTASNTSLAGSFALSQNGYFSSGGSVESGQISADGNGNFAGTADFNNPNGVFGGQTAQGSYSVGTAGRTTATINTTLLGTQNYVMYVVGPGRVAILEVDTGLIAGGNLIGQF